MDKTEKNNSRRDFLKKLPVLAAGTATLAGCNEEDLEHFLQKYFRTLSQGEKEEIVRNLEKEYLEKYGIEFKVSAEPATDGIIFGYALDLSRCIGCRRCVYGCVEENNLSRDPQIHWIQVLQMDKIKGIDLAHADIHYNPEEVPQEGHFYMPVACQQCRNPQCTTVCPTKATYQTEDGIVVVDYDWCIGCRYCMAACPYGARHYNWGEPEVPEQEFNTNTHYFGNRPRPKGVVEKCTFCIQRVRQGRYPACVEVCPTGSRKFGNLLDPNSEIRYILENKRVLVLKEELNTQPKFYYFFGL